MNRFGPSRLMCLNVWLTGSDTFKRYVLVVTGVTLLECYIIVGVGFEGS